VTDLAWRILGTIAAWRDVPHRLMRSIFAHHDDTTYQSALLEVLATGLMRSESGSFYREEI